MKILHVISSGGMYGAEAVILNLSRTLNSSGHQSILGVFANASNPNLQLHEAALVQSVESHLIPCYGQFDRNTITSLRELAARVGADIVHAHGYKADFYTYFFSRSAKIPVVSTCHNWLDENFTVYLYGVLDRLVLRRFAGVVAVSDEVQNRLLKSGVKANKIRLIRNGVDLRPFDTATPVLRDVGAAQPKWLVGLVGRLSPEKGVDTFIRAAAVVQQSLPAARFVVIGDGPDREKLTTLIDELRVGDFVRLLGRRTDMPSVYASLDVMVSSSRQEGLPIAILEGMASRLPIVATPVGQVPTLIRTEETGLLVPVDDTSALAAAIIDLLQSQERRTQFGAAARTLVETEYSAKRMTAEYLSLYSDAAVAKQGKNRSDKPASTSRRTL